MLIDPCPKLSSRRLGNSFDAGDHFSRLEKTKHETNINELLNSTLQEQDCKDEAFGLPFGDYSRVIQLGELHGKKNPQEYKENLNIGWEAYMKIKNWKRPSSAPAKRREEEFQPLIYDEFYDEVYQVKPKQISTSRIILKSRRAGVLGPEEALTKVSTIKTRAEVLEDQMKKKKKSHIQAKLLSEAIDDDIEFYSQRMMKMVKKTERK